jgi:hypothetical protein
MASKAEELKASTTGLLRPWELTIPQMLRLDGSGPQNQTSSTNCALFERVRDAEQSLDLSIAANSLRVA